MSIFGLGVVVEVQKDSNYFQDLSRSRSSALWFAGAHLLNYTLITTISESRFLKIKTY
jgi:hypothetical protein